MNLVDVILHTRVPPGRLVDWTDQAFLLIHLERVDRKALNRLRKQQCTAGRNQAADQDAESGAQARLNLRRVGIRTATDLLKAFSTEHETGQRTFVLPSDLKPPLPVDQLRLFVTVLAAEPGLAPVWNWQRNGVREHRSA